MAGIGDRNDLHAVKVKLFPTINQLLIFRHLGSAKQAVGIDQILDNRSLHAGLESVGVIGQIRATHSHNPVEGAKDTAQLSLFFWSRLSCAVTFSASAKHDRPGLFKSMRALNNNSFISLRNCSAAVLEGRIFNFAKLELLLHHFHRILGLLTTTPKQIIHMTNAKSITISPFGPFMT